MCSSLDRGPAGLWAEDPVLPLVSTFAGGAPDHLSGRGAAVFAVSMLTPPANVRPVHFLQERFRGGACHEPTVRPLRPARVHRTHQFRTPDPRSLLQAPSGA